ncbi:MAG: nucleoside phosphorylase [Clostridia bacterium]|nr:nucleoside phosphorylase [Clostridia bacterium]
MWFDKLDTSKPVITAKEQINSAHAKCGSFSLPETAVIFYMSGMNYIKEVYDVELISERLPRFLNACPIYKIKNENEICLLNGGRGAPQAADTVEILNAYGVKNIISVGMIGGFSNRVKCGDIIIPNIAYSEEGTSMHYHCKTDFFEPDKLLYSKAIKNVKGSISYPVVSTDAVYRQTYKKEELWRNKGAVGVDMEASAIFSVSQYLGIKAVSILMVSDIHPLKENEEKWNWKMTADMRKNIIFKAIDFALSL